MSAMDASMPAETGGGLSEVQRITKVFYSPTATFLDIKRSRRWWGPLILMIVSSVLFAFSIGKTVGWEALADQAYENMPSFFKNQIEQAPPEQQQKIRADMPASMKRNTYMFSIMGLLMYAVLALIYWAIFSFGLGKATSYKESFVVLMYAGLPLALKSLLAVLSLFAGIEASAFELDNPVAASNLAMLFERASSPKAYSFFKWLDLFMIWSTVLAGMGMSTISGVKQKTGIIIALSFLLLVATVAGAIS